jgi:hypothetical protein
MARISVAARTGRRTVTVHGGLRAADLQRLERACGPALEHRVPALVVVMGGARVCDASAEAYLSRLRARGVVIAE